MQGSTRSVESYQRQAEAIGMRAKGSTYQQIADALGYSDRGTCYRDIQAGLKFAVREAGDEVVSLELERCDVALKVCMEHLVQKKDLRAVEPLLKVLDRRARYLGLDKPIRLEVPQLTQEVGNMLSEEGGALLMAEIEAFVADKVTTTDD